MNGFSAADMSTAAANGHRDGYQAGYADAVKAVEVGKPAAAQEAVGWFTDDYLTDKSATTYDPLVAERWRNKGWPVTALYAAPVIAATAWAEGYASGVIDERTSDANIGIAGFGAKVDPARANPYRFAAPVTAAPTLDDELAQDRMSELSKLERDILEALPSVYYMDPPDGGDVSLGEQVKRMAEDAANWRKHASTPAAPGIDLREIGEAMAQAEQHVETLHSLCSRPSVLACIKRLRKAQASLIDSGPKGALPTLPDDFSESKDWRAGSYGERVVWLMDTVRSQREHIAALLGSPKGATLNEQFGSAEGLGDLPGMWEKADLVGGATDSEDGPKGGSDETGIPEPHQECYSNDDGDSWRDSPDDAEFVDGLTVGDTYVLTVSHYSVERTYRVTKAPDETSDDYEVEPVQATSAEVKP